MNTWLKLYKMYLLKITFFTKLQNVKEPLGPTFLSGTLPKAGNKKIKLWRQGEKLFYEMPRAKKMLSKKIMEKNILDYPLH